MRTRVFLGSLSLLALTLLGGLVSGAGAQGEQDAKKGEAATGKAPKAGQVAPVDELTPITIWETTLGSQLRAATAVLGSSRLLESLGMRVAISENVPGVPGWEFDFDKTLPLNPRALELLQDGRTLPDVRRKELAELKTPDRAFLLAYNESIWRSDLATMPMFEKSAAENQYVVYADLLNTPEQYRGKIITVKGKLALIRRADPPRHLDVDHIRSIYTGWIIGPTKGAPPFTVVFTQLPGELEVSENVDVPVTFYGYFLSIVRFPADKEQGRLKKDVLSPYFVGKTVILQGKKKVAAVSVDETPYSATLILWSFGGIVAIVAIAAGMMLWYRKGDNKVQSQLAEVRDKHQPFRLGPESSAQAMEKPPPAADETRGTSAPGL